MKKNWEYGGLYHQHNMDGIIDLPNNSKVQVCDLIDNMPDFMKEADVLFIDPPCSQGNLTSFYTKSDISETRKFDLFYNVLFERILQINPKHLFLEIFASNYEEFLNKAKNIYKNIIIYNSYYYNNRKNKCWIFHCSNEEIKLNPVIDNIDEEKFIKNICTNFNYNCIGDLCMGTGLVGKYAFINNRKFVGTELNKKRLAILINYILSENNQL
jgi:hypothetical protein